ncbi:LysR family transcriptional regulator [Marivita sp.]|uniref:LysR family transcriptional regulator n=1 Tax=Marivita sp. TaxID=2003365 RepID=UPI0025BE4376|nr:LysR family transcriptional regulator [Marivita sp.]
MNDEKRVLASRPISLTQLEAFQAVAQAGSFTRAAGLLGKSQPALSRLLAALSDTVGVKLFERDGTKIIPTPEAKLLLTEAGRVLQSAAGFEQMARDISERRAGRLRIACLPGFATVHLPRLLSQFLKQRPNIEVTLEPDRPENILDWLVSGECDIGLTADFPGHPAVDATRVPIRTVCILPQGHPAADKAEVVPTDLRADRLIHTRSDDPFYVEVMAAFEQCGVQPVGVVETRQFGTACRLVAEGVGVSIVSQLDAAEFAWTGLVARPFFPNVTHNLDVLRSRLSPSSMIAVEFEDLFISSLGPYRTNRTRR